MSTAQVAISTLALDVEFKGCGFDSQLACCFCKIPAITTLSEAADLVIYLNPLNGGTTKTL